MDDPMLQIAGLDAFYGRAHILHSVALELMRGEVLALLGRNGAGKSTTMKAILGLVPPARGSITFEGRRIDRHVILPPRLDVKGSTGPAPARG